MAMESSAKILETTPKVKGATAQNGGSKLEPMCDSFASDLNLNLTGSLTCSGEGLLPIQGSFCELADEKGECYKGSSCPHEHHVPPQVLNENPKMVYAAEEGMPVAHFDCLPSKESMQGFYQGRVVSVDSPENFHVALKSGPKCLSEIKQREMNKCTMCGYEVSEERDLIRHMRTHTGERPFECKFQDCGMAFKGKSVLKKHIQCKHNDDRPFECNFPCCTYTAKTSGNLIAHEKVHSVDKEFACSECDYQTNRKDTLKKHGMRHHSGRRDFKCSHPGCTKSFKSSADLKIHFSNRHEERNVPCDHPGCGQKYANSKALSQHKWTSHSKKGLVCPTVNCSYSTNTKCKLASHMIVHNGGNEKVSCSIEGCQYKAKTNRALQEHMCLHKTGLSCPESGCRHYAPTEEALKKHVNFHSSFGRPFQCPLCYKYYQTVHKLQGHCFAHTSEKPFACGQCEYAAPFRPHVKRHISLVHASVKFPFIVHLLDDRECLDCNVILPTAEFLLHCEGHVDPAVMEA